MNRVAVITISSHAPTEPYYFYKEFLLSCKRVGVDPIHINGGQWCGLMSKPRWVLDWLGRNGDFYDYVIFLDAWDVVLIGSIEEIMAKYHALKSPIVFNSERNCFPRADLVEQFNPSPTPYRFLNSGVFVGTTQAVIDMLREMHLGQIGVDVQRPDGSWENKNDQEFFSLFYLANQTKAALDYRATIAQTLHGAEPDEFIWDQDAKRVKSIITGSQPAVFHGNGGGKAWLQKIMGWLNL